MPSIEEEIRSNRHLALVVRRLCDACAASARLGEDFANRDEGFWNGLSELTGQFVSFLECLLKVLPASELNRELPPAGDTR